MNFFTKLKEKKFDYSIIFLLLLLGLKTLFLEKNYITYDELYSMINYTNVFTLFLKDNLNNHVINSFIGIILSNFTHEINFFRLFSYLAFMLGLIFISKNQNSSQALLIILVFLLVGNNFFVYSFLYRGYSYNFFLFAITFYLLSKPKNYYLSNLILILLSFLTFLAPSNVLIIFPIIFFYQKKFKLKNIFLLYFCLTPILLFSHIILNGIYALRQIIEIENLKIIFFDIKIFFQIILEGLKSYLNLIFGFYEDQNLNDHIKIFLRDDRLILTLYLVFFINIIFKIVKKLKLTLYDKIFVTKIILIIILSNAPVARIYYPFYVFYILYLDQIFKETKINFYIKQFNSKFIKIIFIILLSYNFSLDEKIKKNFDISLHYDNIKKEFIKFEPIKNKCSLDINLEKTLSKDIYYYKYLIKCNKKINIFEIKEFQKK